jgi:tight adherence protein B
MFLLLVMFVSILLATFAMVLLMTRKSPQERTMDLRMALIRVASNSASGVTPETEQLLKATAPGNLAGLDDLLERFSLGQKIKREMMQGGVPGSVAKMLLISLVLFNVGGAVTWFFNSLFLVQLAVGVALGFAPYGVIYWRRKRRIKAFNAVLAETIDMMARALRAGHSVLGAIEMMAENAQEPAASEFGEVFKQMNLGLPMRDALMQLLDRVPSADLRVLVTAIMVQKDTGGNLVDILDRTVFVIRERLRIEGEIQVQTAQGRLTGWILSGLPVIMLLLLNLVNPGYSSPLVHDPLGRKLSYFSAAMLVIGAWMIRRIINGIEV